MHRLARAVTARGWMAYNIEYRRVGRFGPGGWPWTFEDVSDAIDALAGVDGVDLQRVATCGHSAGGHLALWAASRVHRRSAAGGGGRRGGRCIPGRGGGSRGRGTAVRRARGGRRAHGRRARRRPGALPAGLSGGTPPHRQAAVPPARSGGRLGPALTQRAVRGGGGAAGDPAVYVPLPGVGHMEMISGRGATFGEMATWLDAVFGPPDPADPLADLRPRVPPGEVFTGSGPGRHPGGNQVGPAS